MTEINIAISGQINSGRTSLAALIKYALIGYGIKVGDITEIPDDGDFEEAWSTLPQRLESLRKKGVIVNIKTFQENREQINKSKRFRVKDVSVGEVVEDTSFIEEMVFSRGNVYNFKSLKEKGWWMCYDNENIFGYNYHISWLEEVE